MENIPQIKIGIVAVSRDCFPESLSVNRRKNLVKAYTDKYDAADINVYQSNIFHTKMLIKEMELQNYLFNRDVYEIRPKERLEIEKNLRQEMIEIFSGTNIY